MLNANLRGGVLPQMGRAATCPRLRIIAALATNVEVRILA